MMVPTPTTITYNTFIQLTREEDVENHAHQTHGVILNNRDLKKLHLLLVTKIDFEKLTIDKYQWFSDINNIIANEMSIYHKCHIYFIDLHVKASYGSIH